MRGFITSFMNAVLGWFHALAGAAWHLPDDTGLFDVVIRFIAAVSFTTTLAGVISLSPDFGATSPWIMLTTVCIGICLAGYLALAVIHMSNTLYVQFRLPLLIVLLIHCTVAALFDCMYFQKSYVDKLHATAGDSRSETRARAEYDRLSRDFAALTAKARSALQSRLDELRRSFGESEAHILWETKQRPDVKNRLCGPVCKRHTLLAAGYRADIAHLQSLLSRIDTAPAVPASRSWQDLRTFHANGIALIRRLPVWSREESSSLPLAPEEPKLITQAGLLANTGGPGIMAEMIMNRDFGPQLIVPLAFAMVCEYLVVLLVLALRPWRPVRITVMDAMDDLEACVTRAPALFPFAGRMIVESLFRDSNETAARRKEALPLWLSRIDFDSALRNMERVNGMRRKTSVNGTSPNPQGDPYEEPVG